MGYYDKSSIGNINKAAENERKKMECSFLWQNFKTEIKNQWYLFLLKTTSLTGIFTLIIMIGRIDFNTPFSDIVQLFNLLFAAVFLVLCLFLMVSNTNRL